MKITNLLATGSLVLLLTMGIDSIQAQETAYGWQLMTEQERMEHRAKMRSFKTEQEREAYRREHHKRMQERAREKGVTLPDEPQPRGKGMGKSGGGGQGMGSGGKRFGQ